MKLIKYTITTITILISVIASQISFAAPVTCGDITCKEGEICQNNKCVDLLETLVPRPGETSTEATDELTAVGDLPEVTAEAIISTLVRTILGWSMIIALTAIVIAGVYYLQSRGKEEDISKAKSIIIFLLIGLAIMAAAYGFVTGIAQFNFFET
jgi:hypothetical protein